MPSGRTGSRPRVPRPSASISSPIQRASSSPSQWPISRTFSPSATSVQSVLPRRLLVGGDHAGGGGEDVRGRAVVLLEPDHRGAGEVLLEAQDVADLGAAPAVDRLVVVADAADVAVAAGEQPQPEVLRDVGVLVLVDEDVAEPALVLRSSTSGWLCRMVTTCSSRSPKSQAFSVAQPLLVLRRRARRRGGRRRPPRTTGTRSGVSARFFQPSIRPASSRGGQRFSSMFAAWMIWRSRRSWSSVSRMVKFDFSPTSSAWRRRICTRERVEGAEPGHALDHAADQPADAVPSSRARPCW